MGGHAKGLCGAALAALVVGHPVLAQEEGGLQLTFGVTERLEISENPDLVTPSSGSLSASTTSLSFGLSSETRTQVLRLNLRGALRFEQGDGADEPDLFDNPSFDALYSITNANSALTLQASGNKSPLAMVSPTAEDPDPTGQGTILQHSASAVLSLGTESPLGLTLQAGHNGSSYSDPSQTDSETLSYSATGYFRPASGAVASISASHSNYSESDATALERETTSLSLGWTQPLTPVLTLGASLGQSRIDTTEGATFDRTEGLTGDLGLTLEMANGSAGLSFALSQESGASRQTIMAKRTMDMGNQTLAMSLGATRQDNASPIAIGTLTWAYDAGIGSVSVDIGRSVASSGLASEAITDRVALGLRRDIGAGGSLNLNLTAARIDDPSAALVERTDLAASYSRELGADWLLTFGANMTRRAQDGTPEATSRSVFLSLTRNFSLRP